MSGNYIAHRSVNSRACSIFGFMELNVDHVKNHCLKPFVETIKKIVKVIFGSLIVNVLLDIKSR